MTETVNLHFTPKQTLALETMDDPKVKELMYGGAKGGGKSVFLVLYAFLQAQRLIQLFGIDKPSFVLPVGFLGRKRGVDFTKTTLETWKKIIPSQFYKIRPLDKEIVINGRVKIYYGGMDDESSVNKMNSAEFAFICIDQAEEISKDDLGLLKGTLRLRYNGRVPDYKVLLTANPAPSFLKHDYIDSPPEDGSKVFIQALPTDNPFLDKQYIETLTDAFKHRPELLKAYVFGSWDDIEGLDILIKYSSLMKCVNTPVKDQLGKRVTSADVARYGPDETVIYNLRDNMVVGQDISGMNNTETNATKIINMALDNESSIICIDGDGFGAGVVDTVRAMLRGRKNCDLYVLEINSGKKAQQSDLYGNAKTEFWFNASKLIAEGKVSIPDDHLLIQDLTACKYLSQAGGQFRIESKKDIRKRMARSPDRGDALVYGWWATQFVKVKEQDFTRGPLLCGKIDRGGYDWETLPGRTNKSKGYGWST